MKGSRFEGAHGTPESPLLDIINEAKSIDEDIYEGADRSSPDTQMLVSSPGQKEGRFYDCFNKLGHLYTTIRVGLKDCPHISQEKIDAVIAMYGEHHPITRSTLYGEFMDHVDERDAFLTYDMILGCEYEDGERWESDIHSTPNECYVGVDVGRDRDLTVIWVTEKIVEAYFTRRVITMAGQSFEAQEERLNDVLSSRAVKRCCIDETGLGRQFAERAQKRWGSYRVERVHFTGPIKEELAYPVRTMFESRRIRVPRGTEIRADLGGIRQEMTLSGNIRFIGERNVNGHCDRFWALALALHAAKTSIPGAITSTEGIAFGANLLGPRHTFTPRNIFRINFRR